MIKNINNMDRVELREYIHQRKRMLYRNHTSDDISGGNYIHPTCDDIVEAAIMIGWLNAHEEIALAKVIKQPDEIEAIVDSLSVMNCNCGAPVDGETHCDLEFNGYVLCGNCNNVLRRTK